MHFAKYILTRAKIYLEGAKKFFGLFLENTNCKQQYEAWVNTRGASCAARGGRGGGFPQPRGPGLKGLCPVGEVETVEDKKGPEVITFDVCIYHIRMEERRKDIIIESIHG